MAYTVVAYIVVAYIVMAVQDRVLLLHTYVVMAYIVMAQKVMAYIVMAVQDRVLLLDACGLRRRNKLVINGGEHIYLNNSRSQTDRDIFVIDSALVVPQRVLLDPAEREPYLEREHDEHKRRTEPRIFLLKNLGDRRRVCGRSRKYATTTPSSRPLRCYR